MVIKTLLGLQSPGGQSARLSVLIFHRVLLEPDPLFPDEMYASRFDVLCGWLASWFNVLRLDAAVMHLTDGTLPARAACITFDDGYADNHDVAMPILIRHGLTATFFIATGFLDGGRMWNDTLIESIRGYDAVSLDLSGIDLGIHSTATIEEKKTTIHQLIRQIKYLSIADRISATEKIAKVAQAVPPTNLMMTSKAVVAMRQSGMQIGAHTVSHPILAKLNAEQAAFEIGASRDFLENLLGERVGLFAYPNGKPGDDYVPQSIEVVRSLGFDAAVSTQWGASRGRDDLFQIRRFTPWDKTKLRFGARLVSNLRVH
jgi:peptidoglycan/xylan/chitin deacetylase (PgdA/CDA1 family)